MGFNSVGPIVFESVSSVTATNSTELGTRLVYNGEEYVYCYNGMASAATQGVLMIQSGTSGYTMTRSSIAAADMPMVAVKHAAVASGNYFWGLVRGSVQALSLAVAAGDLFTIGTDGALKTFATGSFPTGPMIAKAQAVSTANAQPAVFVCLFG